MRTRIVWVAVFLAAACTLAPAGEPTNLLPNGGFEFTGRFAQEWLAEYSKQAGVKDFDPVVPIGWLPAFNPGVTYELSGDAHGGKKSLHVVVPKNAGGQIAQQAIEVAPRATYTFGLWCKGSGQCHMRIIGLAFEGGQELASKDITAGAQWSRTTQTVEIPGHIRMVRVEIGIDSGSDLLLDDVFFAAEFDGPFDADAVLAAKWQADADTLLLVDFSGHGPEVKLENGAAIVEGGPFGKCLHLDRKQMSVANVSLGVKKMPPEGTLEFWLSLDEVPQLSPKTAGTQQSYLQMHSGDTDVLRFTTAYGQIYGSLARHGRDVGSRVLHRAAGVGRPAVVPQGAVQPRGRRMGCPGRSPVRQRHAGELRDQAAPAVLPDALGHHAGAALGRIFLVGGLRRTAAFQHQALRAEGAQGRAVGGHTRARG